MNDERNLGEKTDDSGQQPRYEHYQFHEEQRTVLKPSGPSGHRRNQHSFQKYFYSSPLFGIIKISIPCFLQGRNTIDY